MYATDRKVADASVGDLQLQGRLEEGFWDHVTGACEALHGTGGASLYTPSPSCSMFEALHYGLREAPATLLRLPVYQALHEHSLIQRKQGAARVR